MSYNAKGIALGVVLCLSSVWQPFIYSHQFMVTQSRVCYEYMVLRLPLHRITAEDFVHLNASMWLKVARMLNSLPHIFPTCDKSPVIRILWLANSRMLSILRKLDATSFFSQAGVEFSAPNPMQLVGFSLYWFAKHFKSLIWIDPFCHYGLRWIDLIWSQMTVIWIDLNCKNGEFRTPLINKILLITIL